MSREAFIDAVLRKESTREPVFGTGTSIVCQELMNEVGACFPEGHLNPEKMFRLALAGHTILGLDVVMPLFSVCHEAAAMGCNVNWGDRHAMPESGKPIFKTVDDSAVPSDLLQRPGCAVPLKAIALLKRELGDSAAVCGKVFGGWTQAYHYFGVEDFLIMTLAEPDHVKKILEKLMAVTIAFANAQIEAGADCLLLADHSTRDLCSPNAYRDFLMEGHRCLAENIKAPLILHICGDTLDRVGMIAQTGLACFHWDTKTGSPAEVRRVAGDRLSLMGGVSNRMLLQDTPEAVAAAVNEAIAGDIDIIGPECAIPLTTPLANLRAIATAGDHYKETSA